MKQIDVPSFSGSFGILPDHVPLLAVLKPGVMTVIEKDDNVSKYFGKHAVWSVFSTSNVTIGTTESTLSLWSYMDCSSKSHTKNSKYMYTVNLHDTKARKWRNGGFLQKQKFRQVLAEIRLTINFLYHGQENKWRLYLGIFDVLFIKLSCNCW